MGAKVNLTTGKIVGCKKGSRAWFHEKGHIEFDKSNLGTDISYKRDMSMIAILVFVVLSLFFYFMRIFALISLLMFVYYFLYEEFWCNRYADLKMKGGKKNV